MRGKFSHYYTPHRKRGGWSDTYLTPPTLIEALGPFALDPACPPSMPWQTARRMYHFPGQDGLLLDWRGFVWLNPPFGRGLKEFAARMIEHGDGVILLNGRSTETAVTQACFAAASAVFFPARRLKFHDKRGRKLGAWFPSLLIGFGPTAADRLARLAAKPRDEHGGTVLFPKKRRE